jgi:UDP-N-acetyl-D-mannosaminuronic acid transferase (WecB/TagA/CpsF family)
VGLGAPKQERWMHEHKNKLSVPVIVSIGAAFDMLSGRKKQAPPWMRDHGLKWLFRSLQEPRALVAEVFDLMAHSFFSTSLLKTSNWKRSGQAAQQHSLNSPKS